MSNGKKPFIENEAAKTGNSIAKLRENQKEGDSQINEFIEKVEASRAGDNAVPTDSSEPGEKRTQNTYSELSQSHEALLGELESSMDRSMQELDARYDREFSRLDDETGMEIKNEPDTIDQHANRMDSRLLECGAKVEMLKARLEQSEDEVCKQCAREVETLREQLAEARSKLAGIKESGEEGWGRVKEGLSSILADISKAVKSVAARLREREAR